MVLGMEWANEALVDLVGSQSHWQVEPQQESALQKPVERKVVCERVGKEVQNREEAEYGPIGEPKEVFLKENQLWLPLSVILLCNTLDCSNSKKSFLERNAKS